MTDYTGKNELIGLDGRLSFVGCTDTDKYFYNRMNVRASDISIKESDTYTVYGKVCSLCLTLADYGYRSFIFAEYTGSGKHIYKELSHPFSFGSRSPADMEYGSEAKQNIKSSAVSFLKNTDGGIVIRCFFPEFDDEKTLSAEISLNDGNVLCSSEAFEYGRQKFYYCKNSVGLKAGGIIRLGNVDTMIDGGTACGEITRCVVPRNFKRTKAVGITDDVSLILSQGGTYEETQYENALFINGKAYYLTGNHNGTLFDGCEYAEYESDNNKAGIVFKAADKPFRNNSGIFGYTDTVSGVFNVSFMNENYVLPGFIRKSFIRL